MSYREITPPHVYKEAFSRIKESLHRIDTLNEHFCSLSREILYTGSLKSFEYKETIDKLSLCMNNSYEIDIDKKDVQIIEKAGFDESEALVAAVEAYLDTLRWRIYAVQTIAQKTLAQIEQNIQYPDEEYFRDCYTLNTLESDRHEKSVALRRLAMRFSAFGNELSWQIDSPVVLNRTFLDKALKAVNMYETYNALSNAIPQGFFSTLTGEQRKHKKKVESSIFALLDSLYDILFYIVDMHYDKLQTLNKDEKRLLLAITNLYSSMMWKFYESLVNYVKTNHQDSTKVICAKELLSFVDLPDFRHTCTMYLKEIKLL